MRVPARLLAMLLPLLPALASSLLLAGCSGAQQPKGDPTKALATAKRSLDRTPGVRITVRTDRLPDGVDGLLSADGIGTHPPGFRGTIKVATSGVNADAAVVATDGVVYAKLPFTSKFSRIDPADYGAPDPARLLAEDGGLSSMLTAATEVRQDRRVRDGKRVLTRYTATVPGRTLAALVPSARASSPFRATFTVDDRDRLARAVLRGPFYPKAEDVTYTVTLADYGIRRTITAP